MHRPTVSDEVSCCGVLFVGERIHARGRRQGCTGLFLPGPVQAHVSAGECRVSLELQSHDRCAAPSFGFVHVFRLLIVHARSTCPTIRKELMNANRPSRSSVWWSQSGSLVEASRFPRRLVGCEVFNAVVGPFGLPARIVRAPSGITDGDGETFSRHP